MFRHKVLQKLLLQGSFSAVAFVSADKPAAKAEPLKHHYRSSELPIYPEETLRRSDPKIEEKTEPTELEVGIGKVRKVVWSYYDIYKEYHDKAIHVIDTGIAHTQSTFSQVIEKTSALPQVQATRQLLLEEENYLHRYSAIALASLTGLVLGARGGRFKRLTYATIGGLGMAAICYPKEAKETTQEAIQQAKKYFTISYNFIYGVTPEDVKESTATLLASPASDEKGKAEKDTKSMVRSPGPGGDQSLPADKNLYTTRS
ncbi:uncharacterized protein LOC134531784 isoform X1 [Bacillus rossius redtenbacheri]|uniref:uncharacterized protein LOC134531784 isoform X1 n=1 Tax=Bacillus rossius redtenbacheri TaxID=93214 RepID=UPI002FDCE907